MLRRPPRSTLFPYTTLSDLAVGIVAPDALDRTDRRSAEGPALAGAAGSAAGAGREPGPRGPDSRWLVDGGMAADDAGGLLPGPPRGPPDRRWPVWKALRRRGSERAI